MSDSTTPVILSAVRTPIGRYLGGSRPLYRAAAGAIAIRDAVARAGVDPAASKKSSWARSSRAARARRRPARR